MKESVMKKSRMLMIGLVSVTVSSLGFAQTVEDMGEIYKNRCANCHGVTANGVPKIDEMAGVKPGEADASGVASQEKTDIHGPALNTMSQEELLSKLMDFRSKGFETDTYHSVMRYNLKTIEAREGKVYDEKMAEYIYTTYGEGAE
jgi:cytochrome c5